jgi:hypothetical protein
MVAARSAGVLVTKALKALPLYNNNTNVRNVGMTCAATTKQTTPLDKCITSQTQL